MIALFRWKGETMREIKFRGKDVLTGKWAYGDLVHNKKITETDLVDRTMVDGYEVDPDTVGQFTGLCDRNGKEIYEGDIVRNESAGFCGVVQYRDATFIIFLGEMNGALLICLQTGSLEIIGNIHDNPELLKGGKQ